MGVQGLLTYIMNTPPTRQRVHLKHLSQDIHQRTGQKGELLCDYFSVIHWLLSAYDWTLTQQGKLPPYSLLYGGDLQQYGSRIVSFVKGLENIDIVPVFFVDGPPGSNQADFVAKFSELKSRYLKKVELGATVQQICDGNNDLLQAKWSLREGISTQVEFALKSAGVRVVYCLGEADSEILRYLQTHDNVCGILSGDTDFAIAYDSTLFLPEYFDLNKDLAISSGSICEYPEDVVCETVTPARVASALNLTETQLPDLSVLCGNDFTRNLNASLSILAALGLNDSYVETVAEWLRDQSGSLLDNDTVAKLFAQRSLYRSAVEHTYNTQFKCLHATPLVTGTPLVEYVHQQVVSGSMSPHLLSIVNGTYWRRAVIEPVALGQPCCNDLTVFLRKSVYVLMGIRNVTEYGRTASRSFAQIPLSLSSVVADGLHQLRSMDQLTTNEKLITLFYIVVNYNELERPSDLYAIQARAHEDGLEFEGEMSVKAIVACACMLFMHLGNTRVSPSPKVAICEVEALVVTCLACAAQLPPCIVSSLPPARAVTLGMWFTDVLEQVYIVASCVGLYEYMPQPADIFSTLVFIPLHMAAYESAGMDAALLEDDAPTEGGRPHMILFAKIFNLRPVLALRAEMLNKWSTPDIPYLQRLFAASLKEISERRESLLSCCRPTPEPLAELEVSLDAEDEECPPQIDPQFELDLDSENSDVKVFACESDSSLTAADYGELPSAQEGRDTEESIYLSSQSQSGEVANLNDIMKSESVDMDAATPEPHPFGPEEEEVHPRYVFVDPPDVTDGASPLTFTQTSNHRLPVLEHRDKILELINSHRVVCIEGETGCGKSTKIPQFILDDALQKNPKTACKILVTQPRRVAAIKLAERVAAERRERVGKTVGYCIGGERHRSQATPLTYCTTGYMLQALVHNPAMIQKYTHIVLDEVHERSIDADFAMLVVRSLAAENPDVKIIVMSATMQGPLLISYFEDMFKCEEVASPYFVGAKRYPIRSFFIDDLDTLAEEKRDFWHIAQNQAAAKLRNLITSRPVEALKTVLSSIPQVTQFAQDVSTEVIISQANLGESILVFLPGIAEISHYHECLTEELIARNIASNFSVFVLHSQVPLEDQKEAFDTPLSDRIHVILATNIAESSITFPKLRMVINFGIYRQLEYNSKRRISCLVKKWSSHASCSQRAGRAGRVFEGVAVHLFSKQFYEVVLREYDPPEMLTAPLAKLVLRAKQIGALLGIPSPSEFLGLALSPPSLEQMEAALQDLADLGAIASDIGQGVSEEAAITLLGHFSLSLPVDLVLCRLILFGIFFGCPIDSIVIAASLSLSQDVFSLPSRVLIKDDQQFCKMLLRSMESRFFYDQESYSDAIMVCNLFRDWIVCLNSSRSQPKPLPRHILARQFASSSVVRWDRMLQLEASVSEIASRVLVHVPEAFELHEQLRRLASLRVSRGAACLGTGKGGKHHQRNTINLHFCEHPSVLKALVAASFSHQILYGARECDSFVPREKKRATSLLKTMANLDFDRSRTLVMRGLKHPTADALQELTARVVPNQFCQVRMVDNVGFIHFNQPFETNPKTELIRQHQESQECAQSRTITSVAFPGLPREAHLLWQFGERRPVWQVEGISAEFTSPRHPCAVSWYRVSPDKESARVNSWRNRTGFLYDLSEDCGPFLGVASALQGGEHSRFVSAKGVTVLPSFRSGPSALLMVLAFQPIHANLELCVDVSSNKITAMRCNSQEIPFDGMCALEADDIVRVNALREAISRTLSSSCPNATIPIETASTILPLLDRVLKRKALLCNRDESFPASSLVIDCPVPEAWEEAIVQREVSDNDSDGFAEFSAGDAAHLSLDSFCYYPPIQCSLVKSATILPIPEEELRSSSLFHRTDSDGTQTRHRTCRRSSTGQLMNPSDDLSFRLSPYATPFVPTGACSDPAASSSLEEGFLSPAKVPVSGSMATGQADSALQNCDTHTDRQEPVVSDGEDLYPAGNVFPGCGAATLPPAPGLQPQAMVQFLSQLFSNLGIVADPARIMEVLTTAKFLQSQQLALQPTSDAAKQSFGGLQPWETRQQNSASNQGHRITHQPSSVGIPEAASIATQTKHNPLGLQESPNSPPHVQRLSGPLASQSAVPIASQATGVPYSMQSLLGDGSTQQNVKRASAPLIKPCMVPRSPPPSVPPAAFRSSLHHSPPPAHMVSESADALHKRSLLPEPVQFRQPNMQPPSFPAPRPTMLGSYPSSLNTSSPLYPRGMRPPFRPATTSAARYSPPAWTQQMYQPMFSLCPQAPRGPRYTPAVRPYITPPPHRPPKLQQQFHRFETRRPFSNVRNKGLQRQLSHLQGPAKKTAQTRADTKHMINFFEQYLSIRGGQAPLVELCGSVYRSYMRRICGLVVTSSIDRACFDSHPDKFVITGKPGSLIVVLSAQMRAEDRKKFLKKDTSPLVNSISASVCPEISAEEVESFALRKNGPEATDALLEEKPHQRLAVFHQMEQIPESSEAASLKDHGELHARQLAQAKKGSSDSLISHFVRYISTRGGEAALEDLCGPVYRRYRNQQSLHTLPVIHSLPPMFFERHPDTFVISGNPGSIMVALVTEQEESSPLEESHTYSTPPLVASESPVSFSEESWEEVEEKGKEEVEEKEKEEVEEKEIEEKEEETEMEEEEEEKEEKETEIEDEEKEEKGTEMEEEEEKEEKETEMEDEEKEEKETEMEEEEKEEKETEMEDEEKETDVEDEEKEEKQTDMEDEEKEEKETDVEDEEEENETDVKEEKGTEMEEEEKEEKETDVEDEEKEENETDVKEEKGTEMEDEEKEEKETGMEDEEKEEKETDVEEDEEKEKEMKEEEEKQDEKKEDENSMEKVEAEVIIPRRERPVCSEEIELLPKAVEVTDCLEMERCSESVALSQQDEVMPENSELTKNEVMIISSSQGSEAVFSEIRSPSSTEDVTPNTSGDCQPVHHTQESGDAFADGGFFESHAQETNNCTPAQHSPNVAATTLGETDLFEYEERDVSPLSVEKDQQGIGNLSQLPTQIAVNEELKVQIEALVEPTLTFQSCVKLLTEEESHQGALPSAGGVSDRQSARPDSPHSLLESDTTCIGSGDGVEQLVPSRETRPKKQEIEKELKVGSRAHMLQHFQKILHWRGSEGSSVHSLIYSYRSGYSLHRRRWLKAEFFRDYPDVFGLYMRQGSLRVRLISDSERTSVVSPSGSRRASGKSRRTNAKSRRNKGGSREDSSRSQKPLRSNSGPRLSQVRPKGDSNTSQKPLSSNTGPRLRQVSPKGDSNTSQKPLSSNVGPRLRHVSPKRDVVAQSLSVAGVNKVEREITRIMCERNRMAFLSDLKKDKKLAWLCQVCGVNLNKQFFRLRSDLFELREEENFDGAGSDCFLILRSQPALEEFCRSKKETVILPLPSSDSKSSTCSNKVGAAGTELSSSSSLGSRQASQHIKTTSSMKIPQRKRDGSGWHDSSKQQSRTDEGDFHETRIFRL